MWELDCEESWVWKIDAFELWCWRRLLRVRWTARRYNHFILKETSPGCSLEGLILKLKLQYFDHLMQRVDSLEKTLMLGKMEGRRRGREDEMVGWHHRLDAHEFGWTPGVGDGQGGLVCCDSWGSLRVRHDWVNWTDDIYKILYFIWNTEKILMISLVRKEIKMWLRVWNSTIFEKLLLNLAIWRPSVNLARAIVVEWAEIGLNGLRNKWKVKKRRRQWL